MLGREAHVDPRRGFRLKSSWDSEGGAVSVRFDLDSFFGARRQRLRESALNGNPRVGYVLSAWPRLSETFIVNQVVGIERLGVGLQIVAVTRRADALDRLLLSAELRERLALAARAKIEACFSVEKTSAQLVSLFRQGRGR